MIALPTVLAILVAIVALGFVALRIRLGFDRANGSGTAVAFKRKDFLTPNELEFLCRLEAAVPEMRFHAQVSMGALLDPAVSRKDGKSYFRARGMFSQKIVDFVAQRRTDGSIVAVIELDDKTHDSEKDGKRDAMVTSAGYRVMRWNSKTKPDSSTIRAGLMPPVEATMDSRAPGIPLRTSVMKPGDRGP